MYVVMMTETEQFAEWLAGQLRNRDMTQADLVRRSRGAISHATISQIVSGAQRAGEKACEAIARGLGLPYSLVLEMAGRPIENRDESVQTQEAVHLFTQLPPERQEMILIALRALTRERQEEDSAPLNSRSGA